MLALYSCSIHIRIWLREGELHTRPFAYEANKLLLLYPAKIKWSVAYCCAVVNEELWWVYATEYKQ